MALVLYRKYRPQKFSQVIGQDAVKVTIQSEVKNNCLAHAFLFCGPRGTGKTTVARILAKVVNCTDVQNGEPCNECDSCREITAGRSLAIVEMDAASHTKVEEIRESIIAASKLSVSGGRIKVFIIDEVHMLSASSFNALLKTLEEPPQKVVFVLATTEVHKIPETIISRCQRFDFRKVFLPELVNHLKWVSEQENKKINEKILRRIAGLSGGYVRDAMGSLGQLLALPKDEITLADANLLLPQSYTDRVLELLNYLKDGSSVKAIKLISAVLDDGGDLLLFMVDLMEAVRKLLLLNIGVEQPLLKNSAKYKSWQGLSEEFGKAKLLKIINVLIGKRSMMNTCEMEQLPLELAVVEISMIIQPFQESGSGIGDDSTLKDTNSGGIRRSGKKVIAAVSKSVSAMKAVRAGKNELKDRFDKWHKQKKHIQTDLVVREVKGDNEQEVEQTSKVAGNQSDINFVDIEDRWEEVLEYVHQNHHSLYVLLKTSKLIGFENGKIVIGFEYAFHREKVSSLANEEILTRVFQIIYKYNLGMQIVSLQTEKISVDNKDKSLPGKEVGGEVIAVDNLIENFGGRVVG